MNFFEIKQEGHAGHVLMALYGIQMYDYDQGQIGNGYRVVLMAQNEHFVLKPAKKTTVAKAFNLLMFTLIVRSLESLVCNSLSIMKLLAFFTLPLIK